MLVARCPRVTTDNPVRVVTGYSDPALEGTTVMHVQLSYWTDTLRV